MYKHQIYTVENYYKYVDFIWKIVSIKLHYYIFSKSL